MQKVISEGAFNTSEDLPNKRQRTNICFISPQGGSLMSRTSLNNNLHSQNPKLFYFSFCNVMKIVLKNSPLTNSRQNFKTKEKEEHQK